MFILVLVIFLRQDDTASLRENLRLLRAFDHALAQYKKIDFFHSYRALETDLVDIFQKECAAASGDLKRVLLKGHGLVNTNTPVIGPCMTYFASPSTLLAAGFPDSSPLLPGQSEDHKAGFFYGHFSIEEGRVEVRHIDPSRKQHFEMDLAKFQQSPKDIKEWVAPFPLKWIPAIGGSLFFFSSSFFPFFFFFTWLRKYELKKSPILAEVLNKHLEFLYPTVKVPGAPVLYVMRLDPPIKASLTVARKLLSLSYKDNKAQKVPKLAGSSVTSLEESLLSEHSVRRPDTIFFFIISFVG